MNPDISSPAAPAAAPVQAAPSPTPAPTFTPKPTATIGITPNPGVASAAPKNQKPKFKNQFGKKS